MARVHLAAGRVHRALETAEQVMGMLDDARAAIEAAGETDPAYLPGAEGTTDPMAIGLTVQRTLAAAGDPRAGGLLRDLRDILGRQIARIDDVDLQQAFFNNIRTHREILQVRGEQER